MRSSRADDHGSGRGAGAVSRRWFGASGAPLSLLLLVCVLHGPSLASVSAQTLSLGPASAPALPERTFLDALDERLALGIEAQSERLDNARIAGDEDWILATSVSIATRAVGRRLIGADPALPDGRAARFVASATIADLAPGVDELARAYVDLAFQTRGLAPGDPGFVALTSRAERARAALGAFLRAATEDPGSPADVRPIPMTIQSVDRYLLTIFDELRPAIEAVSGSDAEIAPAWPAPEPTPEGPGPALGAIGSARTALGVCVLPDGDRAAIGDLLDTLERATRSPTHRRSAFVAATRIDRVLRAVEAIARTPWLDERRVECRGLGAGACVGLLERASRADARRTAESLTRLAGLLGPLEEIEGRKAPTRSVRRAIDVLLGGVLPQEKDTRPNAPEPLGADELEDALGAIERVLAAAAARPVLDPGHFEDPMLRRAWRLMERDYEQAERRTFDALPEIAAAPRRLTSPDVISLLKAHRDALEDLRRVAAIPAWERQLRRPARPASPGGPAPGGGDAPTDDALSDSGAIDQSIRSGAADRLAALGDALSRDRVRALVLIELAKFERAWARFAELPGEAMLRRDLPAATASTGGRNAEVLAVFRRDRREWLVAWAAWRLADVEAMLTQLDRLARVGDAIEACVLLSDPDRLDAIDRWAAIEVREGVGVVRRDAKAKLDMMIDAMLAGDWGGVDLALDAWDRRASAAAMLARVARASERPDWPRDDGARGLVARIGSGVPGDSWLLPERRRLGTISRWMGELGLAAQTDEDLAWRILQYLDGEARRVIQLMDER